MIVTVQIVKNNLSNYSNKANKISRQIKSGKLIKIKKGLYETDPSTKGYLLSSSIYGPSYLSFDYALFYYRLIPERVTNYTSATYDKKKKRKYTNYFGTYLYRDVPKQVYHLDVLMKEENGYIYQIATKEKAICDKLYTLKPMDSLKELEIMLFNDLRIDEEEFNKLQKDKIEVLAQHYHSKNITLLSKYIRRINNG